jgi:acetyl esterase/lipase
MKRILTLSLVLSFVLAMAAFAQAPGGGIQRGIVYGAVDGTELKMNLIVPPMGEGPFPAVLCVHGGAWRSGNSAAYEPFMLQLAMSGYVAAAIEYRFCPEHKWPAQIEDAKCAVRYLRAHAKELKIDPTKTAAIGESAGGHLSLLLGMMDPKDGFEGSGGNEGQSSKVQAVVNLFGPTDFRTWTLSPEEDARFTQVSGMSLDTMIADFVGASDRSAEVMALVSPVAYINAGDPPVLTFHGTNDPLVPIRQAEELHTALEKAGVPQKLVVMEGAGHGWTGPELVTTIAQAMQFLDKNLKNAAMAPKTP